MARIPRCTRATSGCGSRRARGPADRETFLALARGAVDRNFQQAARCVATPESRARSSRARRPSRLRYCRASARAPPWIETRIVPGATSSSSRATLLDAESGTDLRRRTSAWRRALIPAAARPRRPRRPSPAASGRSCPAQCRYPARRLLHLTQRRRPYPPGRSARWTRLSPACREPSQLGWPLAMAGSLPPPPRTCRHLAGVGVHQPWHPPSCFLRLSGWRWTPTTRLGPGRAPDRAPASCLMSPVRVGRRQRVAQLAKQR